MSEWLLFNAKWAFLWDDDDADQTHLSWIFIVLAHWNNSPRVDMSFYSDTLFWFLTNQSRLFLLNATCLAEKQHIPIS